MTELLVAARRRRARRRPASRPGSRGARWAPGSRWPGSARRSSPGSALAGPRLRGRTGARLRRPGRRSTPSAPTCSSSSSWSPASPSPGRPRHLAHEAATGALAAARHGPLLRAAARGSWPAWPPCRCVDNLGLVWVGIEATTIVSALLVGFSRDPAGDRGGLEVPHPRLDRDRLRAARDAAGLRLVGRRPGRDERRARLDPARRDRAAAGPGARAPRLHLRAGRLRHQGRPRPVPHVAARRPQPGAEPDLGAAVGRGPGRVALCPGAVPPHRDRDAGPGVLVDAARRLRAAQPGRGAAVHRRPGRPQAAARVLVDRAPGPRRRWRSGSAATRAARASRSTSPATG